MNRLITFGCSLTYGAGLPDCMHLPSIKNTLLFFSNVDNPSKYSWPALLGQHLELEVVNLGQPGASNVEILYNILEFDYRPTDTVIVMWSTYARDLKFTKNFTDNTKSQNTIFGNVKRRLFDNTLAVFTSDRSETKKWIEYMSEYDYCVKTQIYMNHADLFFKSKNLKYAHYPAYPAQLKEVSLNFLPVHNLCDTGLVWLDKTEDGHPGIESNKVMANNIYNFLKTNVEH